MAHFKAACVQMRSTRTVAENIAIAIGLLAGVLPARRAARLNAVDALRAE